MPDGSERPTTFASQSLSKVEREYLQKEGVACSFKLKKFHSYIFGRHFTLQTNHKALTPLFNEHRSVSAHVSGRIQRLALALAMYKYEIGFKPTEDGNADAMSRLPLLHHPMLASFPGHLG